MARSQTLANAERLSSLVRLRRATLWLLILLCAMFLGAIGFHLWVEYDDAVENGVREHHVPELVDQNFAR